MYSSLLKTWRTVTLWSYYILILYAWFWPCDKFKSHEISSNVYPKHRLISLVTNLGHMRSYRLWSPNYHFGLVTSSYHMKSRQMYAPLFTRSLHLHINLPPLCQHFDLLSQLFSFLTVPFQLLSPIYSLYGIHSIMKFASCTVLRTLWLASAVTIDSKQSIVCGLEMCTHWHLFTSKGISRILNSHIS